MKHLIKCSFIFVLFLFFCGAALAQQNESGREGEPATAEQTPRSTRIINALPDGDQPAIAQRKSTSLPKGTVSDEVLKQVPKGLVTYTPVWKGLDKLSFSDKENALIRLEIPHDLQAALLNQVEEIEKLWNSGEFDQAIGRLRNLEESQGLPGIAVGISWRVPRMTSEPKWGTDVRIGAQIDIAKPCLDFHYVIGNLFAVLKRDVDDPRWTINISLDGGATWQETYAWYGDGVIDVSAAVVDTFLYVGYVALDALGGADMARIRRFDIHTGAVDNVYYYKVVFDKDINIEEIAVTTNADYYDNVIYYLAILTDNSLIYHYSFDGETWSEIATGISNADRGLDACCNEGFADYFLWASYIDTDDSLHVARRSGVWEDIKLDGGARDVTSVGAYKDRIMTVYEYTDYDIKYKVSYDGGDSWYWDWIAQSYEEPPYYHEPHVTGRRGGGFTVVYHEEVGGEPDTCWYRRRDYGTGSGTAMWSAPEQFNEVDVWTGWSMTVEWIPPLDPCCHAYGSIWVGGAELGAYFDRIGCLVPGDASGDGAVDLGDVLFVVSYLYKGGPAPALFAAGDLDCSGTIDLGDVLYLVSYLYKGGPAPDCC